MVLFADCWPFAGKIRGGIMPTQNYATDASGVVLAEPVEATRIAPVAGYKHLKVRQRGFANIAAAFSLFGWETTTFAGTASVTILHQGRTDLGTAVTSSKDEEAGPTITEWLHYAGDALAGG